MLFCWMSVLAYGKCLFCLGWSRLRFSGGGAGIKGKVFYASPMAVAFRNAIGPHVASGLICEATGNAVAHRGGAHHEYSECCVALVLSGCVICGLCICQPRLHLVILLKYLFLDACVWKGFVRRPWRFLAWT